MTRLWVRASSAYDTTRQSFSTRALLLGSAIPPTPRLPISVRISTVGPCSPDSWRVTRTWCSVASGPRNSQLAWRARSTRRAVFATPSKRRARPTDEQLQANVRRLLDESLRSGSTTVECKTGYGQNTESELRSALIAGQFTDEVTLLAAPRSTTRICRPRR